MLTLSSRETLPLVTSSTISIMRSRMKERLCHAYSWHHSMSCAGTAPHVHSCSILRTLSPLNLEEHLRMWGHHCYGLPKSQSSCKTWGWGARNNRKILLIDTNTLEILQARAHMRTTFGAAMHLQSTKVGDHPVHSVCAPDTICNMMKQCVHRARSGPPAGTAGPPRNLSPGS